MSIINEFRKDDENKLVVPKFNVAKGPSTQPVQDALQAPLPSVDPMTPEEGLEPSTGLIEASQEVPEEPAMADYMTSFTDGAIPTEVALPIPESVEGNIEQAEGINGGRTISQVERQFAVQEAAQMRETGQQLVGATDDAITYGSYLPTLFSGPSANDLADNITRSQASDRTIYEAGIARDNTTSNILKDIKPLPQNRTEPNQFRPESTKNPWERFTSWLGGQLEGTKEANFAKGQFGVYGSGFVGGALYTLGTPFNAVVGAVRDLNNMREKAVSSLPKPLQSILNFNPVTEIDKYVNRNVPGHKPLSLFNDNGKDKNESSFLNALRAKTSSSFSDYQDVGVIGMRKRELGLKWYQDPTFWGGLAADVVLDPGDMAIGVAMRGLKKLTPPKTARTAMAQASKEAAQAAPPAPKPQTPVTVKQTVDPLNVPKFSNRPRVTTDVEAAEAKKLLENMAKAGFRPPSVPVIKPINAKPETMLAGVKKPYVEKVPKVKTPKVPEAKKPDVTKLETKPVEVAKPEVKEVPEIPARVFQGEMTLDEFARQLTTPVPGTIVDPQQLIKFKRTLPELSELARKIPGPDGNPLLTAKANFTTWGQLNDRINSLGDDTYKRIFQQYGAKIDLESLSADTFKVVLPEVDGPMAMYVEKAYGVVDETPPYSRVQRRMEFDIERPSRDVPAAKRTLKYKSPFKAARELQEEGIKLVREGKVVEGRELYDEATSFLGRPKGLEDVFAPQVNKAINDELLDLEVRVQDSVLVDRYVEVQSAYANVSEEVSSLSLQLRNAQDAKKALMAEILEKTPDLGRQYPSMAPIEEGTTRPMSMPEEWKVDEALREANQQGAQVTVYQGTRVNVDDPDFYSKRSPIDGGTRAELGPAHYFTDSADEAAHYAKAEPARDLPVLVGRSFGAGRVNTVSLDASTLLDFNEVPSKSFKTMFENVALNIARENGNRGDAIQLFKTFKNSIAKAANYKALYAAYDKALAKVYGIDARPELAYQFNRQVNAELVNRGITGFKGTTPSGANHYAILDGAKTQAKMLDTMQATTELESPLEISASRLNADSINALNNPESLAAEVAYKESAVSLQDSIIQDLENKLDDAIEAQDEVLVQMLDTFDEMSEVAARDQAREIASVFDSVDRQMDDLLRHFDNVNDNPCLY